MIKYLYILFVLILIICCKKSNSSAGNFYNEVSPYTGKTTINFIDNNKVIITGAQLSNPTITETETFSYQIKNNQIYFITMSRTIKDTTSFYYTSSGNIINLNSCPPGSTCYASGMSYVFSK